MTDLPTVTGSLTAMRAGQTTAQDLTRACLSRIAAVENRVHAFVTVTTERALAEAARADATRDSGGEMGALNGIPIALKDIITTKGIRTTAGSRVLADFVPTTDAEIVEALDDAGAVLVGKTNTHEFAWGVFTSPTRNPWGLDRIPGGSSGGSAAAVATGEAIAAIGTDTGGSIRIPAACCGVTGFKPSFGLVSMTGIIPLSPSMDHAGPIARTVEDCATIMDVITIPGTHSFAAPVAAPMEGLRLGILVGPWQDEVDPRILAVVRNAIASITSGAPEVDLVPAAELTDAFRTYRNIQGPEAATFHSVEGWYPDRVEDYTTSTRGFLEHAMQIPAVTYMRAHRERAAFVARTAERWDAAGVDILLAPTLPILPILVSDTENPDTANPAREALLRLTFAFDLLGSPALSVPCGMVEGLPVGLQILGRRGMDVAVLQVGHAFQQRTDWHHRQPALAE